MSNTSTEVKCSIEVAKLTSHSIVSDVIELFGEDNYYFPGDKLKVGELGEVGHGRHIQCVQVEVLPMPGWDERKDNPDWKKPNYSGISFMSCYSIKLRLVLNVFDKNTDSIQKHIQAWIEKEDLEMKYLNHELVKSTSSHNEVQVTVLGDVDRMHYLARGVLKSPRIENVWNKYMNNLITEGVCYIHGKVDTALIESLRKNITYLAENTTADYHPNSNEIVRDHVHPALYSYVKGISKMKPDANVKVKSPESKTSDYWGRPYEDSKFQWLPTPFAISSDGECKISDYVNNLSKQHFPALYSDLEKLFDLFLPYFEEVWSYIKSTTFFTGVTDDDSDQEYMIEDAPTVKESLSLKGRELQVIVKIVEYTLQPGQSYEGVWHAEGMSHENIVMTGIYFLDRDDDITGGDLRFKRAFTLAERNSISWDVPQTRPEAFDNFASEGFVPLGYFPTEEGYMFVFPNCHVHKIAKLLNTSSTKNSSRRIVVFFVINPEESIISTREVAPQQNTITLEQAKSYRLELMHERKYSKDKLNVRDIELCEH